MEGNEAEETKKRPSQAMTAAADTHGKRDAPRAVSWMAAAKPTSCLLCSSLPFHPIDPSVDLNDQLTFHL